MLEGSFDTIIKPDHQWCIKDIKLPYGKMHTLYCGVNETEGVTKLSVFFSMRSVEYNAIGDNKAVNLLFKG